MLIIHQIQKKILQIDKIESTLKCGHKNIISRNKGIIIQKMKSREIWNEIPFEFSLFCWFEGDCNCVDFAILFPQFGQNFISSDNSLPQFEQNTLNLHNLFNFIISLLIKKDCSSNEKQSLMQVVSIRPYGLLNHRGLSFI